MKSAINVLAAPILTVVLTITIAPLIYPMSAERGPARRQSDLYCVESPMGNWTANGRPVAHLNGTVVFKESETGDRIQIDNGGVVIYPLNSHR